MNSWEVVTFFSIYWWVTLLMSDIIEPNNQGDLCLERIIPIVCISVLQNRTCCPSLTMSRPSTASNLKNVLSILIILKSAGLPLLSSSIIVTLVISPHVGTQSIHIQRHGVLSLGYHTLFPLFWLILPVRNAKSMSWSRCLSF